MNDSVQNFNNFMQIELQFRIHNFYGTMFSIQKMRGDALAQNYHQLTRYYSIHKWGSEILLFWIKSSRLAFG